MLTRIVATLALAAGVLILPTAPAQAAVKDVTITNSTFRPAVAKIGFGDQVHWTNAAVDPHTSTSDQGFWASQTLSQGEEFTQTFPSAGTFHYHCEFQSSLHGSVEVPVEVGRKIRNGWKVRWATGNEAPDGRDYGFQYRKKGTRKWHTLAAHTPHTQGKFTSSKPGRFQIRVRTNNTDNGKHSGWSPPRTVKIS